MQNELSRSQLVFRGITSTAKGNRAGMLDPNFICQRKERMGRKEE